MSFLEKQEQVKKMFGGCSTAEEKYQVVIELGKRLPLYDPAQKIPSNLVHGCQSEMYLHTVYKDGILLFNADSEALISKGLAALLIAVFSEETPQTLLTHSPDFLRDIGLFEALSPGRSNGLMSLHLRMKQEALKYVSYNL